MDIVMVLFCAFFAILVLLYFRFRFWLARREEDYYYDRLYWTMRDAQEDAQRSREDKEKHD